MSYRVILKNLKAEGECIVLESGIESRDFALRRRREWRRMLGGKNWTQERRPGLDTFGDSLGLKVEPEATLPEGPPRRGDAVALIRMGLRTVQPPPQWLQQIEDVPQGANLICEGRVFEVRVR